MKKILLTTIAISIFLMASAYAVGNATKYVVTVQNIQMKNDAGQWITVAQPNQQMDIAAVGAGTAAGSFMNDASIPVGNYVNFKIVVSETMTVAGADGVNFTAANGSAVLTGAATSAGLPGAITAFTETTETHNLVAIGDMTIQINLHAGDADDYIEVSSTADFGTPIAITPTSKVSMWFDFDVNGTINYVAAGGFGGGLPATNAMYFTQPAAGTEFSITVDGKTTSVTAANMTLAF